MLIDPSELPVCDCTSDSENPCGPEANCLNRMLQFECNPTRCPGKENCQNQRFQKRQYVDCEAFRTLHRGWGLRCKEGGCQEIIVYKLNAIPIKYISHVKQKIQFCK